VARKFWKRTRLQEYRPKLIGVQESIDSKEVEPPSRASEAKDVGSLPPA
jgi:hypothetical protein